VLKSTNELRLHFSRSPHEATELDRKRTKLKTETVRPHKNTYTVGHRKGGYFVKNQSILMPFSLSEFKMNGKCMNFTHLTQIIIPGGITSPKENLLA